MGKDGLFVCVLSPLNRGDTAHTKNNFQQDMHGRNWNGNVLKCAHGNVYIAGKNT